MIESGRWYSAMEISENDFIFWVKTYKTVLTYLKHPKYREILQPKIISSDGANRYYVKGSAIKKFLREFQHNNLKGKEKLPKQNTSKRTKENWQPAVKLINEGKIPGIKTYYSLKKAVAYGKLKGIKLKVENDGKRSFYFVEINSLPKS
jgi:hypothetical protein